MSTVVEKPAATQTSNQLASSLDSAPNSWSGGHELESLVDKLGELTDNEDFWGQSFCSSDSNVIMLFWTCKVAHCLSGCLTLTAWYVTSSFAVHIAA
jgi:hypothetical protein